MTRRRPATRPRIRLAYRLTPHRVLGDDRVTGIEFKVTGTDESRRLEAGLVLTSIGYRGKPIRDLPFDETTAVVPNDGGRVVDPQSGRPVRGSYVAGWIKRGPTGFIGTNKSCAAADRAEPGRRLQRRSAGRPGRQARRTGQARAQPAPGRGRRRRLAGHRQRRDRARQCRRRDRATSSPPSPTCWPRPRPRQHRRIGKRLLAGLRR